ncbi:MAG: UvrD-helicase domain-containing protein [Gammaproteobacteria bacterium]|jgi:ATP-dependent exoDNAse (exonuclease V) beta subunit|nr:UvrD-helicase domain-containing protein [Gammaproteobacteria bacterium]
MKIADTAPDEELRVRAIEPDRSFLVQAPAGAGKTELLIQRYLRLLSLVEEPEEILAITFTRKAAAEMQRRICLALAAGTHAAAADSSSARRQQALVAAVRSRDRARGWRLGEYPSRLRISTIDSLNSALARSAPVSSGANVLRPLATQFEPLYRQAARDALRLLGEDDATGKAVASLLGHFDNQFDRLETLLAEMLACRDQWLPVTGVQMDAGAARAELEAALARVVSHELDQLQAAVPPDLLDEICEVVQAAAINRGTEPGGGPDARHPVDERLAWWQFTAATLLTKTGGLRSRLSVKEGFPPAQKDLKAHAAALIGRIGTVDGLLPLLASVPGLPPPVYPEVQWAALEALLRLLPVAAAGLKLVFAAQGQTDYVEIAAEGRAALGDLDGPSELAMRVDWRIRHVLLDEFQDTSQPQYELLQALTRGWSPGDGRTLFLVGDPMQSIYGFRQAEVRLFLASRDQGMPGVPLEFIRLSANFRSAPPLVAWVNRIFPQVFPPRDDLLTSAIAFVASEAAVAAEGTADDGGEEPEFGVRLHASPWAQAGEEAQALVGLVERCLQRWPDNSIGILVRSRVHADAVVSALRGAQIDFSAPDLVQIGKTAIAAELLALTHALLHAGDRLAWLSVLRAPWCGLTLADLEALADPSTDEQSPLAERCSDERWLSRLSADGAMRVSRLAAAISRAHARLGQIGLRDVIEGLWVELGGPAVAGADLPLADLVLDVIAMHDKGGDCPDLLALDEAMAASPSSLPAGNSQVQVMTIHKAKGLQFDTVILPGLGRETRSDRKPALLWQEVPSAGGRSELLLAPVNQAGDRNADPLYALLWRLRRQQRLAETDRLLYVAATRARKRLHLYGQLKPRDTDDPAQDTALPATGSLLERLWPALAGSWPAATGDPVVQPDDPLSHWRQPALRRLPADWQRPPPPPGLRGRTAAAVQAGGLVPYDWASSWAKHAGSVAHRWLQHIATVGVEQFPGETAALRRLDPGIRRMLVRAGVDTGNLDRAAERVHAVLANALADERGRWLLSGGHSGAVNEYPLTVKTADGFRHLVIDRSFICEQGMRWVVDYKTSSHEGGDRAQFIASESLRHAPQLHAYQQAFAQFDSRTVCVALYFPLLRLLQRVDLAALPAGSE